VKRRREEAAARERRREKAKEKIEEDYSSMQGKERFLKEENNRDPQQLTHSFLSLTFTVDVR